MLQVLVGGGMMSFYMKMFYEKREVCRCTFFFQSSIEVIFREFLGKKYQFPKAWILQYTFQPCFTIPATLPFSQKFLYLTRTSSSQLKLSASPLLGTSFMAIFFFTAYSAFYSLLSLYSSMILISFSTVLSTSQNSFPSFARQRAQRYLISVLFKFSMQRRQKECPHSRLMGWIISSKQMEHVNSWGSRQALSHRQLIFLFCCLLTIFFFSYFLLKRDLRSFLVTLCNRALQIFFPVVFSVF